MDKELLFKSRLTERDVEVPGVGTVRVRALSRAEVLKVKDKPLDESRMERMLLSYALIEPELTEAEIGEWQAASEAGEIEAVCKEVMELSGLGVDSAKEAYKSVRD